MSLVVLEAFGLVEVQGPPQLGVRQFGVPVGGWFDHESAMVANVLVHRATDSACLELTMAQFRFQTLLPFLFSVAGAASEIRIDHQLVGLGGVFGVDGGSTVSISPPRSGVRTYVSGLFTKLPPASTRIGVGDTLEFESNQERLRSLRLDETEPLEMAILRVLPGPQAASLDLTELTDRAFTVSEKSNRVGIRMRELTLPHQLELPSEPAGFGAVQITPDGTAIVLGPDGPTIGGYPKIAYVISADLDKLGRLRPGQKLSFELVTMDTARDLARERSRRLERRHAELSFATQIPNR